MTMRANDAPHTIMWIPVAHAKMYSPPHTFYRKEMWGTRVLTTQREIVKAPCLDPLTQILIQTF